MEETKAEDSMSAQYIYNNTIYNISASEDFHLKIGNDTQFAVNYFEQLATESQVPNNINENKENIAVESDVATKRQKIMQQCPNEGVSDHEAWDNDATKFLLNEYYIRKERFRNSKIKKILLWREIEAEFKKICRTFSASELSEKFGNMKTTYSTIKKNNSKKTTGTSRKSWPWLAQMDEIFHNDVSINFTSDVVASMPGDENTQPINLSSQAPSASTEDASMNCIASKASTSEVSSFDESGSEAPPNWFKSARGKSMYYHRQKQLELDANKLEIMKTWNDKFVETKKLQEKALTIWNERMLEATKV